METLTPAQRVAVIAIGLALTTALALLIVPWLSKRISDLVPATATPTAPATPPATSSTQTTTSGAFWCLSVAPEPQAIAAWASEKRSHPSAPYSEATRAGR